MDLAVACVALIVSVVALSAAIRFGRTLAGMPAQIATLRSELELTRKEVDELKAAAEVIPAPPPLPRTRSAGLDDLRQQLREAHREADEATDA